MVGDLEASEEGVLAKTVEEAYVATQKMRMAHSDHRGAFALQCWTRRAIVHSESLLFRSRH